MKKLLSMIVSSCFVMACSGGVSVLLDNVPEEDVREADSNSVEPDAGSEDAVVDLQSFDTGFELVFPDVMEDTGGLCLPGEGCFLDPCVDGENCLSGWCVEHMGEGVCTQQCTAECPPGWSCQQVAGTAPDLVFVCVSDHANLCRPCATGDNCKSVGGAEDVCVDYGVEGSFCGGTCVADDDCPWGFSCAATETVDGIPTKQCVADAGSCPCTNKAVELALWTPCDVTNEFGTCTGKRICSGDGLAPCDAPAPGAEICDGLDNDCDGETDNLLCDDGNACTQDSCDPAEGCQHEPLTGTSCDDGDVCTLADHCEAGECEGSLINCDDGNVCTDDACNPMGGCVYVDNLVACDDGDPCTVKDTCLEGSCSGYVTPCDCKVNADCGDLEDGDLCNGTLYCDQSEIPFQCAVVPETVVACEEPASPCLAALCDPLTGNCGEVPANDGVACDDGNACTIGEACAQGECVPGPALNCNDGDLCTTDLCDPATGCFYENNSLACNDGDACTVGDLCQDGTCQGTGALTCDDGNVCTDDDCDPGSGCIALPNVAECDDGNACTLLDLCVAGACAGQGATECDDENLCTTDKCDPVLGCVFQANSQPCDDGDACSVNDTCTDGFCVGKLAVDCDDGDPCTNDSCDDKKGCVYKFNQDSCDDGNLCTTEDTCDLGQCLGLTSVDCDDENPCTKDSCMPDQGCLNLPAEGPCDDGDPCTVKDACMAGECVGAGAPNCNDGNPCTDDSCDPATGCINENNSDDCFDGDVCTTGDVCQDGECLATGQLECDDDNFCTDDSCDPKTGCKYAANDVECDDGNACTSGDLCAGGQCVGGAPPNCNDGNPCTDDSCDVESGCAYVVNTVPCDDGEVCTINDKCAGGVCVAGDLLPCNDNNLCTDDACQPGIGCQFVNNAVECDDDNACTTVDVCAAGECVGSVAPDCNDDNICTDDSCDTGLGCVNANNSVACDDSNACTTSDTCAAGSCVGGPAPNCDDGDACTADSCNTDTGCVHTQLVCCGNGVKDAGEACDDGNQVGGDGCSADCKSVEYKHNNGQGVIWYNGVPTGTLNSSQAKLSCQKTYGTCYYTTNDCAGPGWCQNNPGGKCWGWTSGCSGGAGRVWQYSSSYTTYGNWN